MQPGKRFLVWLAGLSVLGFLATDMYLPAFAAIQADLQTPASAVSASLSLFLAGFAAAQLLWGPLSDRYGRKPVLLIGLTIFALGSLGMLWVENAATLLVLRFVQAVGVCAAALQNTLQLGLCFLASLVVSWLISISTPLLTTTSVMLSTVVLVALGYMMQRCEEVGCQNHGNAEVAHSESH